MDVRWVFDPITLQSAEIVAISELCKQLFEDHPVTIAARSAEHPFEMKLEVGLDPVVVQQCIIDIDQENDRVWNGHAESPFKDETLRRSVRGLRQIVQPSESLGRQHLLGRLPTPIAFGMAGQIHPRFTTQVENVLQRRDRERGGR